MGPEQFGEELRVERKDNELKLLIRPRRIRFKPGVWPALIGLIVLAIIVGIALWFWMGPPFSFGGGVSGSDVAWQNYVWLVWLFAMLFLLMPPAAVFTLSTSRKVTIRTDADASVHLQIKQPYSRKSAQLKRSEIENLRLQRHGNDSLPSREHNTVLYGVADWWLRFETPSDGAYAINIPINDEHTERFAGLIGDAFGQECSVVRTPDSDATPSQP